LQNKFDRAKYISYEKACDTKSIKRWANWSKFTKYKRTAFPTKTSFVTTDPIITCLGFFLEYMYNIIDVFIIIQDSTWLGSLPCAFELPVFQAWCDILGTVSQLAAGWKRSAVHPA
jgi:hypothetical protein